LISPHWRISKKFKNEPNPRLIYSVAHVISKERGKTPHTDKQVKNKQQNKENKKATQIHIWETEEEY
jgi:hypothetical protein